MSQYFLFRYEYFLFFIKQTNFLISEIKLVAWPVAKYQWRSKSMLEKDVLLLLCHIFIIPEWYAFMLSIEFM